MTSDPNLDPTASRDLRRGRHRSLQTGAIFVAAALCVLTLAGCYNGLQATTTMQSQMNSGNGAQERIGSVRIENATMVLGPPGSKSATLIMSVFNDGATDDALLGVLIGDSVASPQQVVELPAYGSANFGYGDQYWVNACDLDLTVSTYVPVAMQFEKAGILRTETLIVEPTGYYEGIAPNPAC